MGKPTFFYRGIKSNNSFLFHFSMKFMKANRVALDGTPLFAATYLGLFLLPMSSKKDARLIWVNTKTIFGCSETFLFYFWANDRLRYFIVALPMPSI